jgi:iron-sulfur cluster assembly protein
VLTITNDAAEAIRVVRDALELPESAGLRISTAPQSMNGTGPSFAVEFAPQPTPEDQVLEGEGAQIFLAPEAEAALDDKQLDADIEAGGEIKFTIEDRGQA